MSESLNELRKQVRKRHAQAGRKVSRLRRTKGVEIAGTKHDVRRPAENIGKYNRAQLTSYMRQLNQFQARSTTFVAGAQGAVFTGKQVAKFEDLKSRLNLRADYHAKRVAGVRIDPLGTTVAQRRAGRYGEGFEPVGGDASQHVYATVNRDVKNVVSADALDSLNKQLERRLSPRHVKQHLRGQREQFRSMAGIIGINEESMKKFDQLNNDQFNVLWNETNIAELAGGVYWTVANNDEAAAMRLSGMIDSGVSTIEEYIDWAQNL